MSNTHSRLLSLLRERSIRRGSFTLSSGAHSDFYVDVKQTSLYAEGAWCIAKLILSQLHSDVVAVGGLTLGADPIACATAALSFQTDRVVHAFLIRKEAKGHGTKNYLEGVDHFPMGMPVAIVEDTTTTGTSLLKAVERATIHGFRVVQCLTVVDRQEGAAALLAEHGFHLEALTTRAELIS